MTPGPLHRALVSVAGGLAMLGATGLALVGAPAQADPLNPSIEPDAVLSPGETAVIDNDDVLFGVALSWGPDACRGNAATADEQFASSSCRAYRIKLNRDRSPGAVNTVFFQATFDQMQVQSLPIVAAGLNPPPLNGYNIYVYDQEDHYLGQNAPDPTFEPIIGPGDPEDMPPGGNSFAEPEIGSFVAKTDVYDFVVQSSYGIARGFELTIGLSNELFKSPREILDEIGAPQRLDEPTGFQPSLPSADEPATGAFGTVPALDVAPDGDITGIGLGTTEQFGLDQLALGPQTRAVAVIGDPPSTLMLTVAMVVLPLTAGAVAVWALRRRSRALVG